MKGIHTAPKPKAMFNKAEWKELVGLIKEKSQIEAFQRFEKTGMDAEHADEILKPLKALLDDENELIGLNAAYAVGKISEKGTNVLLDALINGSDVASFRATYGLQTSGEAAVLGLMRLLDKVSGKRKIQVILTLGAMGSSACLAVPALIKCLQDQNPEIVLNAAETLGMIQHPVDEIALALTTLMNSSPDNKVSAAATLSLLRISKSLESHLPTISLLKNLMKHEERYVKGYAIEALTRIKSDHALDALLSFFRTSRWCSITTPKSLY
jgi:HEAT repeat protein